MATQRTRKAEDTSLLDKLKAMPASQGRNKPLANLTKQQQQEWEAIKSAIKNGELSHLSRNEIRRQVAKQFNIDYLAESTFRKILVREGVITPSTKEN